MKYCLIILTAMLLPSLSMADNHPLKQYRSDAVEILKQLKDKNHNNLTAEAMSLVNTSKSIVTQSIKALPQCTEYLTALLEAADTIATLPLDIIESGYHADGKLPPLKDGSCYHAKDLLVHPATVQAMATQGIKTNAQWKQAAHEIEEVLEHLSAVESVYANN